MKIRLPFFLLLFLISNLAFSQEAIDKGIRLIDASKYGEAQVYFQKQLDSCENECPTNLVVRLKTLLGKSLHLQNQYDSALVYFLEAIAIANKSGDKNEEVFSLTALAEMYRSLFVFDKALGVLKQADEIRRSSKIEPENLAYFYNRYAAVLSESSDDKSLAISYSKRVLDIAREIGDKDLEASSLNELGFIYEDTNNQESLDYYEESLRLYTEIGNPRYATSVLSNLSRACYRFGKYVESLKYAKAGLQLCKDRDWVKVEPELYFYLFQNYTQLDESKQALEAYQNFHRTYLAARESEWNQTLYEIEGRYDLAEKEKELTEIQHLQELSSLENDLTTRQLNYSLLFIFFSLLGIAILIWTYNRTRKSNQLLARTVREKEAFRKEIHHRVKNNLTFLKSLLYLRANASTDKEVKTILDECQSRIQTMAFVHETLYDREESEIDIKHYLEGLYYQLEAMFKNNDSDIDVNIQVEAIHIDLDRSIFLGLIINELVTNSFKYAFNENEKGSIAIEVREESGFLVMSYADSGPGMSEGFNMEKSTGFGFRLIHILLSQLKARYEYINHDEKKFKFWIPK